MIDYRKFYWLISLAILLIAALVAWLLKFYDDKGSLTALIDVSLTSIALTIAILEILMVRNIAESSKEAVNSALGRIAEIISVSDISKGIKTAYDIQKYLRNEDSIIIAHIRMQDLKSIVIPLKNDMRFNSLDAAKKLPPILSTLSVDINNIDSWINGKKNKTIDISKINSNLEGLVSVLIELESHIKSL